MKKIIFLLKFFKKEILKWEICRQKKRRRSGFPLMMSGQGETVKIIDYSNINSISQKLSSIGLNIGSVITVKQKNFSGGIIISKDNYRLGIDSDLANSIIVAPCEIIEHKRKCSGSCKFCSCH